MLLKLRQATIIGSTDIPLSQLRTVQCIEGRLCADEEARTEPFHHIILREQTYNTVHEKCTSNTEDRELIRSKSSELYRNAAGRANLHSEKAKQAHEGFT